jgi:predicted amidophosphoribosyltransferase
MADEHFNVNNLTLNLCPSCGAPVDLEPGQVSVHCQYCNASFTVPSHISALDAKSIQNARNREFINYLKIGDRENAIRVYMQSTNFTLSQATKIVDKLASHFSSLTANQDMPVKIFPVRLIAIIIIAVALMAGIPLLLFFLL